MAKITYQGSSGQDTFEGTSDDQYFINGKGGKDTLTGGVAGDYVNGGSGDDSLDGRAGNDLLFGKSGDDQLVGGSGNDLLRGGAGADDMNGGAGNDLVFIKGDDTVTVGQGVDVIAVASIPNSIPDGLVTVLGFTNAVASFNFGGAAAVYDSVANTWTLGGMTIQSGDGHSLAPSS